MGVYYSMYDGILCSRDKIVTMVHVRELKLRRNVALLGITYIKCKNQESTKVGEKLGSRVIAYHALVKAGGLGEALVLVSNLLISFSSFSIPKPLASVCPIVPCLSNRYVNKFFLSSAKPSKRANR